MDPNIWLGTDDRPEWIILQGAAIRTEASDFMLDAKARRRSSRGHRRALVHDENDRLTINFNFDYPGGVIINDLRELKSRYELKLSSVAEISPYVVPPTGGSDVGSGVRDGSVLIRGEILLEHARVGGDLVTSHGYYDQSVNTNGENPEVAPRVTEVVSLHGLLAAVQAELASVKERLATLERQTPVDPPSVA